MELEQAQQIAEQIRNDLFAYTFKCEIVGAIRRQDDKVYEIEMTALPRTIKEEQVFKEPKIYRDPNFAMAVRKHCNQIIKGDLYSGRYCQLKHRTENITLELYMPKPESWGSVLFYRTGPKEFAKYVYKNITESKGIYHVEGYVSKDNEVQTVATEQDYFDLLGLPYIEPEHRTVTNLKLAMENGG